MNVVADALLKRPQGSIHAIYVVTSGLLQRIKNSCLTNTSLIHIICKLEAAPDKVFKYSWKKGQLRWKGRLVIGKKEELRKELLTLFHNSPKGGTQALKLQ